MLEKPDIADEAIAGLLGTAHALDVVSVDFLPLGGDVGSAVYRVIDHDGRPYFCKLRRGEFDKTTVTLPRFLYDHGVAAIIAPMPAESGALSVPLADFSLVLYPFIAGTQGYDVELSEGQWAAFGAAVRQIHSLTLPPEIAAGVRRETYSAEWRDRCRALLRLLDDDTAWADPVAAQMGAMWRARRAEIQTAVNRAEELAVVLAAREAAFVICHTDLHPGNLLIDEAGAVFIVDWDYPRLAPKECDLLFIGGGQGFLPYIPEQEERLFYAGYGSAEVDPVALAYYRYERGITDITVESERILSAALGQADREQALEYLGYYWLPGNTLERAAAADF